MRLRSDSDVSDETKVQFAYFKISVSASLKENQHTSHKVSLSR